MFRLFYSNRTEELLTELARRVRAQQLRDGPLLPVSIVVPSAAVDAYVRVGVARTCGVAANLDVSLLTRFAASTIARATGARLVDAAALEAMALTLLLDDEWLASADAAPLAAYLRGAGDAEDAVDLRRVQLASRIGRIFEEYTYSRGDMLAAWRGGLTLDGAHAETERWQRTAWLAMFGDGGLASTLAATSARDGGGSALVPLHEAVARFDAAGAGAGVPLPRVVHVFAFSHVGHTFHQLLSRLARSTEVVVYALSPCEGFWEDVDRADPEPLRLWARPGREQVRALNASAGFDHDDRFVDATDDAPRTLLRQIQSDVMRRDSGGHRAAAPDQSLALLEHASVRRELEAVASDIWRLCEAHEDLRFDEIAVLVPDGQAADYAAQLTTVFREAHDIPHQTVGLPVGGASRIAEAIGLLLALPLGRFTRQDLLRVAVHPSVVASLGSVDAGPWVALCDALGIVHGADRSDHEGTYIQRDILNWDQGLRRLALGVLMAGDATGERRPFVIDGESYVPHEVPTGELEGATALGRLIRSLVADARFARKERLRIRDWAAFFASLVETYVAPVDGAEEEELAACARRLYSVGELDLGDRPVGYRVAYELARERLSRAPSARGGEGVVLSTLAAIRPLPFRVVYACGMGEGLFPASDAEDPLDLRWARRREGDVTARERDRYAFLELLLGSRDRLVLSYVSRDAVTGDALAPSSVVQELAHAVAQGYGVAPGAWRLRHPLRRWDLAYFPDLHDLGGGSRDPGPRGGRGPELGEVAIPEARAEALALALRRRADAAGMRPTLEDVQRRAAVDEGWAALARHLELPSLGETAPPPEARLSIPLYAIVKFLEFPLQGWARFRLGLDEAEDDDVMAREDEPFETALRDKTVLLRRVLLDAASRRVSLEEAYDAEIEQRALRGQGPSGVFARGERENHLAALETWRACLEADGVPLEAIETHRFGRAGEHARADAVHPALALDVDVVDRAGVSRIVRVEVTGRTMPMGAAAASSLALLARPNEERDNDWARADRERVALRAFVDHAVLSASGVAADSPHEAIVVVATSDDPVNERRRFPPLSRDRATVWLRGVVRDLLAEAHPYFLPCEAIFARRVSDPTAPLVDWIERARARVGESDERSGLRSVYGPVPRVREYPAPDEPLAQAIVDRRFGPLLESPEEDER
jgi:exodeoxyribonuclease V gamma subunit